MSAAIDRLRTARDGHHALAHVWPADLRDVLADLDAAEIALVAERTRADAAEAEVARLTTERDATRAEAAGLRAAIAAERAVRAAWLATLPACATAPADVVAAEAATGAALAGEGR